jgi:ADP-heptose:LPS heptosyltransferase
MGGGGKFFRCIFSGIWHCATVDRGDLLVVKPSSLGDIVHGLQVLAALKDGLPELRVDWVVRDCFADVVRHCGLVDRVIPFHRGDGLRGLLSCCRAIRAAGPHGAVWDMQGLLRSGLMTFSARAPRKIGRRDSRECASLFYGERVPLPKGKGPFHAVEILMEFLPTFGLARSIRPLNFSTLAAAVPIPDPYAVIAPESSDPKKNWPHYAALADDLRRRLPDWHFVWVGLAGVGVPCQAANCHDLRGKTSLAQLIALIRDCRGVIANDSGCAHLAAAMGRPTLTLFRSTDPVRFAPYPPNAPGHFAARNPPVTFPELERFLNFMGALKF